MRERSGGNIHLRLVPKLDEICRETAKKVCGSARSGPNLEVVHEILMIYVRVALLRTFGSVITASDELRQAVSRGLAAGLSCRGVVEACRLVAEHAWRALLADADDTDSASLLAHADIFFRAALHLEDEINRIAGDLKECHAGRGSSGSARLASALIAGEGYEAAAMMANVALPATYSVVVTVQRSPRRTAEGSKSYAEELAFRLSMSIGRSVLAARRGDKVVLLVPRTSSDRHEVGRASEFTSALLALARRTGLFGVDHPPGHDQIPTAVRQAIEVHQVAVAMGYRSGVYAADDMLLEIMLYRAPDLAKRLACRVAQLYAPGSHLADTLEVFLASGQERRTAAKRLHVHPNTLSYRLRRIHQLTELSPGNSKDLGTLRAGLVARRLLRAG